MFVLLNLLTVSGRGRGAWDSSADRSSSLPRTPSARLPGLPSSSSIRRKGPTSAWSSIPPPSCSRGSSSRSTPRLSAKSAPAGQTISIEQFGWTSGTVSTQVAKDRSFAYEPPKGFTKVDSLLEQPGGRRRAEVRGQRDAWQARSRLHLDPARRSRTRPGRSPRPSWPARSS